MLRLAGAIYAYVDRKSADETQEENEGAVAEMVSSQPAKQERVESTSIPS